MKQIEKSLLLAEKFGANFSNVNKNYVESLLNNVEYKTLIDNVDWASNFHLVKSEALVEDFKKLNYECKTLEEALILTNRINYLSSISYEEYYVNPLIKYDFKIKTKTIGELMLVYDGKYVSFNDLANDKNHHQGFKNKVIVEKCNDYVNEVCLTNQRNVELLQNNKGIRSTIRKYYFYLMIAVLFGIIFSLCALSVFCLNIDTFKNYLKYFSLSSINTYIITFGLVFACIYDLHVCIVIATQSRVFYPYYYFKHVVSKKNNKRNKEISELGERLALYIVDCVTNSKPLDRNITSFSTKSIDDREYSNYKKMYDYEVNQLDSFIENEDGSVTRKYKRTPYLARARFISLGLGIFEVICIVVEILIIIFNK